MLRIPLLVLLACSAQASDDQSLLQSGMGVAVGEVQQAMRYLGEKLADLPYPGKMRQMAIDALMKSVSEVEKLDADAVSLLNEIIDLLKDILAEMEQANVVDQGALNEILTVSTDCTSDNDFDHESKHTAAVEAGTSHATCRGTEDGLNTDEDEACGAAAEFMNQYSTLTHCSFQATTSTEKTHHDAWALHFSQYETIYHTAKGSFAVLAQDCRDAMKANGDQKTICDGLQNSYENKYCLWHQALTSTCSGLSTCYSGKVALHATLVTDTKVVADKRVQEARVIDHVKCLLGELVGGSADLPGPCTDRTAGNEAVYQATYNVTPVTVPPPPDCDDSPAAIHPGTPDWFQTAYTAQNVAHYAETTTSC